MGSCMGSCMGSLDLYIYTLRHTSLCFKDRVTVGGGSAFKCVDFDQNFKPRC